MLYFGNQTQQRVYVAIMFHAPDSCGGEGGDWATRGWWPIDPGGTVGVFEDSSVHRRYYAYYAQGDSGARWTGPYGPIYIYNEAFDSCIGIGSTAAIGTVGTRLVDVGDNDDFTVNLTP
jgi:uncharacterized membrane protein